MCLFECRTNENDDWVAIRTKSLFACVICHAVANLLLGIYVTLTQQWGYW